LARAERPWSNSLFPTRPARQASVKGHRGDEPAVHPDSVRNANGPEMTVGQIPQVVEGFWVALAPQASLPPRWPEMPPGAPGRAFLGCRVLWEKARLSWR